MLINAGKDATIKFAFVESVPIEVVFKSDPDNPNEGVEAAKIDCICGPKCREYGLCWSTRYETGGKGRGIAFDAAAPTNPADFSKIFRCISLTDAGEAIVRALEEVDREFGAASVPPAMSFIDVKIDKNPVKVTIVIDTARQALNFKGSPEKVKQVLNKGGRIDGAVWCAARDSIAGLRKPTAAR